MPSSFPSPETWTSQATGFGSKSGSSIKPPAPSVYAALGESRLASLAWVRRKERCFLVRWYFKDTIGQMRGKEYRNVPVAGKSDVPEHHTEVARFHNGRREVGCWQNFSDEFPAAEIGLVKVLASLHTPVEHVNEFGHVVFRARLLSHGEMR